MMFITSVSNTEKICKCDVLDINFIGPHPNIRSTGKEKYLGWLNRHVKYIF